MSKTLTPAEAIEAAARALYGHSIRRTATVDERVLTWDELDLYAHLRWFGDAGVALLAVGYVGLLPASPKTRCPTCDTPEPARLTFVGSDGDVQVCADAFHESVVTYRE